MNKRLTILLTALFFCLSTFAFAGPEFGGGTADSESILADTEVLLDHVHSASKCYPTLANGAAVIGGAAWTLGVFKEIVPANTIRSEFDIHYVVVEGASVAEVYELVLYAATVEVGRARVAFIDVANSLTLPSVPIQTDLIPADTQIQAKVATETGADTLTISIHYHTY